MAKPNPFFTRVGWLLVAGICIYSGTHHVVTQTMYGRVHVDNTPLLQGWIVVVIGLLEIVLGLLLIWLHWRRR